MEELGAIEREIKKWPQILREYNSNDGLATAKEYEAHVQYLSEWILSRHAWCYIALGLNNQEKGERMKAIRPVIRVLDPESMQAGTAFSVKVLKSDANNNKYTYCWNDGSFTAAASRRISQKGKYWVKIKDEWGNISLTSDTLYFGVNPPSALISAQAANSFFTCNNPVNDVLHISYLSSKAWNTSFQLFDLKGNTVVKKTIPVFLGYNNIQIPVSDLANGMYIIHFYTEEGVISRKVIIHASY